MMVIFILFSLSAIAKEGKITLLAVTENPDGTMDGTTADLFLELKPGTGRVFIDTYPLTKIDTQISTRFAKDIACSYLDVDCTGYDFFYTIKSGSSIIGGPSAGAATSLLTAAVLLDLPYDKNLTITGTINSGGIIGPVGGVAQKVKAASKGGMEKVLLPKGEEYLLENGSVWNMTGEGLPKIVFVSTLDDAMFEFTGRRKHYGERNFSIHPDYSKTMENLAVRLCGRAEEADLETASIGNGSLVMERLRADGENLTAKGRAAFGKKSYYSAASHCFGASVAFHRIALIEKNLTDEEIRELALQTLDEISAFEKEADGKTLRTITDLQAYMVVKERLIEARDNMEGTLSLIDGNMTAVNELAFGIERLESARLWSDFFGAKGETFALDSEVLAASCLAKISEAQERYSYSLAYLPTEQRSTQQQIERAHEDYTNGDYALCLFKASKAKAESDIILNAVSINEDMIDNLIDQKLDAARSVIADASSKNIFPIVGYSYYEYAGNLKETDKFSALLYAEYALELSNFDVYFKKEYQKSPLEWVDMEKVSFFLVGFGAGILVALLVLIPRRKKVNTGETEPIKTVEKEFRKKVEKRTVKTTEKGSKRKADKQARKTVVRKTGKTPEKRFRKMVENGTERTTEKESGESVESGTEKNVKNE